MADLDESVYASVPFKFIVDGEPLYIHADLVSLHSKPLERKMNEAQECFAPLEDVDKRTFVRFIEWAHKGYYTAAKFSTTTNSPPAPTSQSVEEAVPTPQEYVLGMKSPSYPEAPFHEEPAFRLKKGKKIVSKSWGFQEVHDGLGVKGALKEAFDSRTYTIRRGFPSPRPNKDSKEDYTDVFLSHAQLYVFAEKYDVQSLKNLALEELHATLVVYTLYDVRTGDIIELLRYVYANICRPQEGVDDMRSMITQYVGYKMDVLMEAAEFVELIIESGEDLLRDFMKAVSTRIRLDD